MTSVSIRSRKPDRKTQAPEEQSKRPGTGKPHAPPLSPSGDLGILIAKRAYELYSERGYRHGSALDDWLEAEREILSHIPPV
ncbi:MAG: DUF2934 domain-containing protein [Nitrospirota bacterium]|nr:DUF2934 domain-containing protein [Nitrospirota bacterium]